MQGSKKKGFAFYFLSGLLAVFLIVAGLVYVQLRDLDNLRGMVVFLAILAFGFIYVWRNGALEWE